MRRVNRQTVIRAAAVVLAAVAILVLAREDIGLLAPVREDEEAWAVAPRQLPPPAPVRFAEGPDPGRPPPSDPAVQLSVGLDTACAVRESGRLICWGGSLARMAPAGAFRSVTVAVGRACAVRESGAIVCWDHVARFSAAQHYTCALSASRELVCWGNVPGGQLAIPAGTFQSVSAGGARACAIRDSGELACWGWMEVGPPAGRYRTVALGYGSACAVSEAGQTVCWHPSRDPYVLDPPVGTYREISASGNVICAIRTSGEIDCWGRSVVDQPDLVAPPAGTYRSISVAGSDACAVNSMDRLVCWGTADAGAKVIAPPATSNIESVSVGRVHACVLEMSGDVDCWRFAGADAVGAGGRAGATSIVGDYGQAAPPPPGTYAAIEVGVRHSCALRRSGKWCAGVTRPGQCPTSTARSNTSR